MVMQIGGIRQSIRALIALVFILQGHRILAQSPGGVVPAADNFLWLKAHVGTSTTTHGAGVAGWNDQSLAANHFGQLTAAAQPVYNAASLLNYHPTLLFSGAQRLTGPDNFPVSQSFTKIAVFKSASSTAPNNLLSSRNMGHALYAPSNQPSLFQNGNIRGSGISINMGQAVLLAAPVQQGPVNAQGRIYVNGRAGALGTWLNDLNTDPTMQIGAFNGANFFLTGEIAELIAFNREITPAERLRVESYLAIKYGISLDQTVATNYLASNGTVVWDATTNSVYASGIAGIGRDDATALYQKQSKQDGASWLLAISLGNLQTSNAVNTSTFDNDLSFLTWGHNALPAAGNTALSRPAGIQTRIERVWKAQRTNFSQQVSISVELSQLAGVSSAADIRLLLDDDGDFSNALVVSGTLNGSRLEFSSQDFNGFSNLFFTIGSVNNIQSPLRPPLPGGVGSVSSNFLWLRSDLGSSTTTNGAGVSQWNSQALGGNHFVQATPAAQPVYNSASLQNFHPTFVFNGAQRMVGPSVFPVAQNYTKIAVYKSRGGAANDFNNLLSSAAGAGHALFAPSNQPSLFQNGTARNSGISVSNNRGILLSALVQQTPTAEGQIFVNGRAGASDNLPGQNLDNTMQIGAFNGASFFMRGEIAEIIAFNYRLSTAERRRVESYLAIKYGISLDQTVPTNYEASDGTVVWDATANAAFAQGIAGIGRDDISRLDQRQSTADETVRIVSIGIGQIATSNAINTGSFSNNLSFLTWGHNGALPEGNPSLSRPAGIETRLARAWKAQRSGFNQEVVISFSLSQIGGTTPASNLRLLIDDDGDFSDALVVGGGVLNSSRLEFTLQDFDGFDRMYFTLGSVNQAQTPLRTPLPGGVGTASSNFVWLKADVGTSTTTNGTGLSQWDNQAIGANHFTQATLAARPVYNSVYLQNFHPTIIFNGGQRMVGPSVFPTLQGYTKFVVYSQSDAAAPTEFSNLLASATGAGHSVFAQANELRLFQSGQILASGLSVPANRMAILSAPVQSAPVLTAQLFLNGQAGASQALPQNTNNTMQIGAFNGASFFHRGAIAEVIAFDYALNNTERQRVESYLAIKYGIALSQQTPTNYVASNGSIVWSAAANAAYGHDVAGMGRDDRTLLNQKQSRSSNDNWILSISLGNMSYSNASNANTYQNDLSYLVWGHNGASTLGNSALSRPAGIETRLARVWKAQATNMANTNFTIAFELSQLNSADPPENLRLLIDDDGNFGNADVIGPGVVNNGRIEFAMQHFGNFSKMFFTLGSINFQQTPLPVELLSFKAEVCGKEEVCIAWATATEQNNALFTVEKSPDGKLWSVLGSIAGAGNSSSVQHYRLRDTTPFRGLNYYRLKQRDTDGTERYFNIVSVRVEARRQFVVYPNPASEEVWVQCNTDANGELTLSDAQGKVWQRKEFSGSTQLALGGLASGVYIIRLHSSDGVWHERLLVR